MSSSGSSSSDSGEQCDNSSFNWWKPILSAIAAAVLIFIVLVIAQKVSLFWGVFLFVIPISAGIVVFSLEQKNLNTFVFFMMLSAIAFLLAISVMYTLLINDFNRYWAVAFFYGVWFVITGLFFWIFKDKLTQKNCDTIPIDPGQL